MARNQYGTCKRFHILLMNDLPRHDLSFLSISWCCISSTCTYGLLLAYSWRNAVVPCLCTMHCMNAYAFTIQVGLSWMMFFLSVKLVASKHVWRERPCNGLGYLSYSVYAVTTVTEWSVGLMFVLDASRFCECNYIHFQCRYAKLYQGTLLYR